MTKSLLEQWQEDCQRLSKPHLQWQYKDKRQDLFTAILIKTPVDTISKAIENNYFDFRRIESLALPFDLEDAMNGGKVEFMNIYSGKWENVEKGFYDFESECGLIYFEQHQNGKWIQNHDLRMKESRLKTTGEGHD